MWRYGQGGPEPTLDEVIHEPVIRLMMERDHVAEEALLRIINIAPNISLGGRTAPAEDGLAAQFMYENTRATTRHCKLRVDVGGESAFRDREDDGIGAFYWLDEGFGYAIGANADRALLLRLAEIVYRQTAPDGA